MKKMRKLLVFMMTVVLVLGEFMGSGIGAKAAGTDHYLGSISEVKGRLDVAAPSLGAKVVRPIPVLLSPENKGVSLHGIGWQKSKGQGYWEDYSGEVFEEGTYRPIVRVHTESFKDSDYDYVPYYYYCVINYNTKLYVNGTEWKREGKLNDYYDMNSTGFMDYAGPEYKVTIPSGHHSIIVETDSARGKASASKVSAANGKGKATLKAKINGTTVSISVKVNN